MTGHPSNRPLALWPGEKILLLFYHRCFALNVSFCFQHRSWCLMFTVHLLINLVSKLYWNCLLTHKIMLVLWLLKPCIWELPSSGIVRSVTRCLLPHVCRPFSGLVYIWHYTASKLRVTNNESRSAISQKKGAAIQKTSLSLLNDNSCYIFIKHSKSFSANQLKN